MNDTTITDKNFAGQPLPTPTGTTTSELCTPTPPQTNIQPIDSIVKACLPFADLLKGAIVHVSFDCPENLRTAFNLTTKANGSSNCHVLRCMMEAYVVSNHYEKACYGNTMKPVVIENVHMPTYVKSRRRRLRVVDEASPKAIEAVCAVCGKRGFAKAIDGDGERVLCDNHLQDVKRKLLGWKVLEGST